MGIIRFFAPTPKEIGKGILNALKITRAIIRNFDTYKFDNSIEAREVLNNIIGIYK